MSATKLELTYDSSGQQSTLQTTASHEDGRATGMCHLSPVALGAFVQLSDLVLAMDDLIGGVSNIAPVLSVPGNPLTSQGRIVRRLPIVHPFLELPLAGITSITGAGKNVPAAVSTPRFYTPGKTSYLQPTYAEYSDYFLGLEFRKRDYAMVDDSYVGLGSGTYYRVGDTSSDGITYYYAREWERFCPPAKVSPLPDQATTELPGTALLYVPGAAPHPQFNNSPYTYLQNQLVELTWMQVPYRYYFDTTIAGVTYKSYLRRFVGCVNQYAILDYGPGELLYLGCTPQAYLPMIPTQLRQLGNAPWSKQILANFTLRFIATSRPRDAAPNMADTQFTSNLNAIPFGHNVQPNYADRKFYYAYVKDPTDRDNQAKWRPFFSSFPFELFFTDPLLSQPTPI